MRALTAVFLTVLCLSLPSQAQHAPEGSHWQRVQALPIGTPIIVKAASRHAHCDLQAVTPQSLTCRHGAGDLVFTLAEIHSVKLRQRGKSAAYGAGIGAAAGALSLAAASNGNGFVFNKSQRGAAAGAGAVIGGFFGALVGAGSDFAGSTIDRAK